MKYLYVDVKGYKIYAENRYGELYDIFIPHTKYYLTKHEAKQYINETDRLLAVKRETRSYKMNYNVLKDFSHEEIIKND